ncbi:hypothetical protein RCL1_003190 [Eukaryota sp. TZLM3-RCL]
MVALRATYLQNCQLASVDPVDFISDILNEVTDSASVDLNFRYVHLTNRSADVLLKTLVTIKLRIQSLHLWFDPSFSLDDEFCSYLLEFSALECLYLESFKITECFSNFLRTSPPLKSLTLCHPILSSSAQNHLTSSLSYTRLSAFSIVSNKVHDSFFSNLIDNLPCTITLLSLKGSSVGSKSCSSLSSPSFLESHPYLRTVDVDFSSVSNHSLSLLQCKLRDRMCSLTSETPILDDESLSIALAMGHASIDSRTSEYSVSEKSFDYNNVLNIIKTHPQENSATLSIAVKRLQEMSHLGKELVKKQDKLITSHQLLSEALKSVLLHRDSLENQVNTSKKYYSAQIEQLQEEISRLQSIVSSSDSMIDDCRPVSLRSTVDYQSQTEREPVDVSCRFCPQLQLKLKKFKESNSSLRSDLENITSKYSNLVEVHNKLIKQFNKAQSDFTSAKDKLSTSDEEKFKLKREIEYLRSNLSKLETNYSLVSDQNSSITAQLSILQQELNSSQAMNEVLRTDYVTISKANMDHQMRLQSRNQECNQLSSEVSRLSNELKSTSDQLALILEDRDLLSSMLNEKEELLSSLLELRS